MAVRYTGNETGHLTARQDLRRFCANHALVPLWSPKASAMRSATPDNRPLRLSGLRLWNPQRPRKTKHKSADSWPQFSQTFRPDPNDILFDSADESGVDRVDLRASGGGGVRERRENDLVR